MTEKNLAILFQQDDTLFAEQIIDEMSDNQLYRFYISQPKNMAGDGKEPDENEIRKIPSSKIRDHFKLLANSLRKDLDWQRIYTDFAAETIIKDYKNKIVKHVCHELEYCKKVKDHGEDIAWLTGISEVLTSQVFLPGITATAVYIVKHRLLDKLCNC
jgi:hypothetical protein